MDRVWLQTGCSQLTTTHYVTTNKIIHVYFNHMIYLMMHSHTHKHTRMFTEIFKLSKNYKKYNTQTHQMEPKAPCVSDNLAAMIKIN